MPHKYNGVQMVSAHDRAAFQQKLIDALREGQEDGDVPEVHYSHSAPSAILESYSALILWSRP